MFRGLAGSKVDSGKGKSKEWLEEIGTYKFMIIEANPKEIKGFEAVDIISVVTTPGPQEGLKIKKTFFNDPGDGTKKFSGLDFFKRFLKAVGLATHEKGGEYVIQEFELSDLIGREFQAQTQPGWKDPKYLDLNPFTFEAV